MGKPFHAFRFQIPTLPRETYKLLKELETHLGMNQWEVIVFAIRVLAVASKDAPEWIATNRAKVKELKPWGRNAGVEGS